MLKNGADHLDDVLKWLECNVRRYQTPESVSLSGFEVEWSKLSGTFDVSFDGVRLPERLKFSLSESGWVEFRLPVFHSPLGAPASYTAVEMSEETSRAIRDALRMAVPRIRPCGLDRESGCLTYFYTPVSERIVNSAVFEVAKQTLSDREFSVSVKVTRPSVSTQ